jgi:hypothetical protein
MWMTGCSCRSTLHVCADSESVIDFVAGVGHMGIMPPMAPRRGMVGLSWVAIETVIVVVMAVHANGIGVFLSSNTTATGYTA